MPVTPAGLLAEPLNDVKTVLLRMPSWQAWAGTDYASRIHLGENRTWKETPWGTELYYNEQLEMPFIILWLSGWELVVKGPSGCHANWRIVFFVQDLAVDRADHSESANTFLTNLGGLMGDLLADFDEQTVASSQQGTPAVNAIEMLNEPVRASIAKGQGLQNDIWTATFGLVGAGSSE